MRLNMWVQIGNTAFDLWPFALMALIALLALMALKTRRLSRVFFTAVFGSYLIYAIDYVFFPLFISGGFADASRQAQHDIALYVNLVPFYFGPLGFSDDLLVSLLQNVLLTIPFGFGLSFLFDLKPRTFLWLGLGLGLFIETAQFIMSLMLGFAWRYADIHDVLMNALGVVDRLWPVSPVCMGLSSRATALVNAYGRPSGVCR